MSALRIDSTLITKIYNGQRVQLYIMFCYSSISCCFAYLKMSKLLKILSQFFYFSHSFTLLCSYYFITWFIVQIVQAQNVSFIHFIHVHFCIILVCEATHNIIVVILCFFIVIIWWNIRAKCNKRMIVGTTKYKHFLDQVSMKIVLQLQIINQKFSAECYWLSLSIP